MDEHALNHLDAASEAVQKLDKKLRLLANKGKAGLADVADAKAAMAALRAIYDRYGESPLDIDGRAEKAEGRRQKAE